MAVTAARQADTVGASTSYTVNVTPSGGFAGTVARTVSGLPSGAIASFTPPSVTTPGSSTMTVTSSPTTPTGTYPLTITGTSGSLIHTISVTLTVTGATPTTNVAPNNNPSTFGAGVTFTAHVSGSGVPTGAVPFMDGTTTLGPASLNASGQATLTTSLLAAGTHSITAVYGGDSSFNGSTSPVLSQVVNPAVLTVTANNQTKIYGSANPPLTVSYNGFVNGETLATSGVTGAPSLTTTATPASAAGGCPSVAAQGTLAAANYAFTYVNGILTITKAAATVTAGGGTKAYGASDPVLSATATGFTAADAATITLTATRAAGEAVGSYATTATASGAALSNYTVTYVAGTFSITKAAATVTAHD